MIRIKGIVKTANQVKSQLQQGIHPQEIDSFKEFVLNSVATVENICKKAKTSPNSLPAPSRKAYYYLKQVDLENLPRWECNSQQSHSQSTAPQSLRIKNVIKIQKDIQLQIRELKPNYTFPELQLIHTDLTNSIQSIDRLCKKNDVSPAALTAPSRKAYAWMKYLSDLDNLKLHIQTTQRIQTLASQALKIHKSDIPEIQVIITNFNGLYKYRKNRQGNIELHLNEGFIQAEDKIFQAIINTILGKNKSDTQQPIRRYSQTAEYSDIILELDLIADVDAETPQGNYYNLEELFHAINQEYFAGKMAKPRLTWNKTLTHRKLGHYEPLRDRVVMSRTLDRPQVPEMVVELVLYHELLHKHHGVKWLNGKRMAHTPEFRRSERKFRYYREAEQWLDNSPVIKIQF